MKTLKSFVLLSLIAVFITACGAGGGSDNPGATDTAAPSVSSTSPANGSAGVAMNSSIAATFSEAMDSSTINGTTFTLSGGSGSVSGTVICNGTTATLTPSSNLSYNTTYTATITTGAKDAAGNAVASNYTWNFTTGNASDTTPPTVSSTNPANNATGVAVNSTITATFSETMDTSSITTATFYVGGVSGTVTYNGTTATFTPSSNLSYNTAYTVTVTNGAKDAAGNAMVSNYTWSFTTGSAPDTTPPTVSSTSPTNNATWVGINSAITATFSETMDSSTITTATFYIGGVSGSVTYNGTTATFTPSSNLIYNTTYTVTVTNGIKDAAGNAVASNYTWSFTTGVAPDTTRPTVSSTSPANNATGVAINGAITATFSEIMDSSTVTTATFTLKQGTTAIAGTVTYTGTTTTFTPSSSLSANSTYVAILSTGVKDAAGNNMALSYMLSFTTGSTGDSTAPTVTATSPTSNASSVAINSSITATFSETMDATSINTTTFTISKGGSNISGTVTYAGSPATFTPSSPLIYNATYTATISNNVKDAARNKMTSNYTWNFTTASYPANHPVAWDSGSISSGWIYSGTADINLDGINDLRINIPGNTTTAPKETYYKGSDFSQLWQFTSSAGHTIGAIFPETAVDRSTPVDLDGDGQKEVLVMDTYTDTGTKTITATLYIYNASNHALKWQDSYTYTAPGGNTGYAYFYPIISDIDGDGVYEIILQRIAYYSSGGSVLYDNWVKVLK